MIKKSIFLRSLFLIFSLSIFGFGCQKQTENAVVLENQLSSTSTTSQTSGKDSDVLKNSNKDVSIEYPSNYEEFGIDQDISIQYQISKSLKNKISTKDVVELYLIKDTGELEGWIEVITDYSKTKFIWNPRELKHNRGLDYIVESPKPGNYRVLIVVRPKLTPRPDFQGDFPMDTLDGVYVFKDNKLFYTSLIYDHTEILSGVIALDVSDSVFSLK